MANVTTPPPVPVHHCAYCTDEFTTAHPSRRFCSVRCSRAYNVNVEAYRAAQSLVQRPTHLPETEVVYSSTIKVGASGYPALLIDANVQQQLAGSRPTAGTPGDWLE